MGRGVGLGGWYAGCRILEWMGPSEERKWAGSKETVESGERAESWVVKKKDPPREKAGLGKVWGAGSHGEGSQCQGTWAGL